MLFFLTSFSIQAKTYKCTDKDGKVSYGTSPCKEDVTEKEIRGIKLTSESNPDLQNKAKQFPSIPSDMATAWKAYEKKEQEEYRAFEKSIEGLHVSSQLTQRRIWEKNRNEARRIEADRLNALYGVASNNNNRPSNYDSQIEELENRINSQKSQMENEMRMKQMQMENQQRMEIHRMESQQRLRDQGILR